VEIEEFLEVGSVAALLLKRLAGKSGKDASPPRVHPKRYASTRVHRDHISARAVYSVAICGVLWHQPLPYSDDDLYESPSLQPTKYNAGRKTHALPPYQGAERAE